MFATVIAEIGASERIIKDCNRTNYYNHHDKYREIHVCICTKQNVLAPRYSTSKIMKNQNFFQVEASYFLESSTVELTRFMINRVVAVFKETGSMSLR